MRQINMGSDPYAAAPSLVGRRDDSDAAAAVTALYRANALGMIRLAHVMLGDGPSGGPSAETAMLNEEERVAVMSVLRRLPHRQREVLILRFYLDMTEQEIATEMGIGRSTVRSATHRALVALGHMLGEST